MLHCFPAHHFFFSVYSIVCAPYILSSPRRALTHYIHTHKHSHYVPLCARLMCGGGGGGVSGLFMCTKLWKIMSYDYWWNFVSAIFVDAVRPVCASHFQLLYYRFTHRPFFCLLDPWSVPKWIYLGCNISSGSSHVLSRFKMNACCSYSIHSVIEE